MYHKKNIFCGFKSNIILISYLDPELHSKLGFEPKIPMVVVKNYHTRTFIFQELSVLEYAQAGEHLYLVLCIPFTSVYYVLAP